MVSNKLTQRQQRVKENLFLIVRTVLKVSQNPKKKRVQKIEKFKR